MTHCASRLHYAPACRSKGLVWIAEKMTFIPRQPCFPSRLWRYVTYTPLASTLLQLSDEVNILLSDKCAFQRRLCHVCKHQAVFLSVIQAASYETVKNITAQYIYLLLAEKQTETICRLQRLLRGLPLSHAKGGAPIHRYDRRAFTTCTRGP